jgi:hypothetical protein
MGGAIAVAASIADPFFAPAINPLALDRSSAANRNFVLVEASWWRAPHARHALTVHEPAGYLLRSLSNRLPTNAA